MITLVLYIPFCFAHVLYFRIRGTAWLHEQWLKDEDEDDDDDEGGCCGCGGGGDKEDKADWTKVSYVTL